MTQKRVVLELFRQKGVFKVHVWQICVLENINLPEKKNFGKTSNPYTIIYLNIVPGI